MKKIFTFFFCLLVLKTFSQPTHSLIARIQGSWQEITIDGKLQMRFWSIKNNICTDYNYWAGKKSIEKTAIFFMNNCPDESVNLSNLRSDIKINDSLSSSMVFADSIAGIWCYWYDIKKDTLQIVSVLDARNLLRFVKIKKNIDTLKIGALKSDKTFIFSAPKIPTKMYLQKGDEVEIIEEKNGWLRIRFYGKKVVEGWIKKGDLE